MNSCIDCFQSGCCSTSLLRWSTNFFSTLTSGFPLPRRSTQLLVKMAAASTTSNPLNDFIGAAGAAASVVKSANSAQSSPTSSSSSTSSSPSTTAAPAPAAASASHAAAAAHHGLSSAAKIGIIVGCIVAGLLLLALLGLCCCCLVRRRRRRSKRRTTVTPVGDEEVKSWKSPINPGHHYSNYSPAQRGEVHTEQSPTVPLMATAAAEHHLHNEKSPSLSQHPAMRQPENPFVPELPSPRRTAPNSRAGLTDGMVPGDAAYIEQERPRKSSSRSRSSSETSPQSSGLPTHTDANRPPTPFGLTGFGTPAGHTIHSGANAPYSAIGQPYEDQHVQNLQVDAPSRELQHSLHNREVVPRAAFADDKHPKYRTSRGYTTPPEVPSRSPHRDNRTSVLANSSEGSELSTTSASNSSGEPYRAQTDPYDLYQSEPLATVKPWEQHHRRFSNSPQSSSRVTAPPPILWEDSEYNNSAWKHQSHSPRQSGQYPSGDGRRRSSRSPATSINGQPRRLRFEDLQADNRSSYTGIGQRESYDGYNHNNKWSPGVGEAL